MAGVSRSMSAADWAQILLLSVVWGGSYFFVGVAVAELHPLVIVFSRIAIGAAALLIVVRAMRLRMPREFAWWRALFAMSILNNIIPWILITWSQTQIASGLAAIFNATTPLFTVVIANFFTVDEKLTTGKIVGVLLGIAGVAVLIGPGVLSGLGVALAAQIAALLGSVSYACSGVYARRFHDSPVLLAAGQMICSTLLMLPVMAALLPFASPAWPGMPAILSVTCLGLFSTAFGYLLVFRVLRTAGATNFSLVTFLLPVTAIILGAIFLNENLEPRAFAGLAIIGAGLAAIDGRPAVFAGRIFGRSA